MDELTRMQAEEMAERRFIDKMASAGLGYSEIAKEVLFFLPRNFVAMYEDLWYRGIGGSDDGGVNKRGMANAEAARVGKAGGKGAKPGRKYKKYWFVADEEMLALKDEVDKRLRGLTRYITVKIAELELMREGLWRAPNGEVLGNMDDRGRIDGKPVPVYVDEMVRARLRRITFDQEKTGRVFKQPMVKSVSTTKVMRNYRANCPGCGRWLTSLWKFCAFCGVMLDWSGTDGKTAWEAVGVKPRKNERRPGMGIKGRDGRGRSGKEIDKL